MGRVKQMCIDLHERLIEQYLDEHPNADEEEAHEATYEQVYGGRPHEGP